MSPASFQLRFAAVVLSCFGLWVNAAAADRRIAVRPIEVYNAPDLGPSIPGLQAALAGRLSGPGSQVSTLKPGEAAAGDWAVRVTLTRVGSRMSVDGVAEPAVGQGEVLRAYEIAESTDGVLPALSAVAATLRKSISEAPIPVPKPGTPASPAAKPLQGPTPPTPPTPPSPPLPPAGAAPLPTPPAAAPPTAQKKVAAAAAGETRDLGKTLSTYRVGAPLAGTSRALAVSDVDRDGSPEVLVLTDTEILAFRDDGQELKLVWRAGVGRATDPAALSAGDVDGDGVPELFVAGLSGGTPCTEVYQWTAGGVTRRGPVVPAFLRAVSHPEKGLLLLGMVSDVGQGLFGPKLRSFAWSNGTYRDQGTFAAPFGSLVTDLDWHRLREGEKAYTVATTQNDTLRILDGEENVLFSGTEEVKGSDNVVTTGDQNQQDRLEADYFRLQGKTLLWRDAAGTPHLVLQKNHAFTTAFKRSRSYTQGQVLAYRWEGLGLAPSGQSPRIPGYLVDLDLGPSALRRGASTLYGVLNQTEGILLTTKTLRVLAWDL